MAKYQPLEAHLRRIGQESIPMTFSEIEEVIGAGLPASAFKHRAWWSNNPANSVITHAWLEAGYKSANVDLPGRRLEFRRAAQGGPSPRPGGAAANGSPECAGGDVFARIFGALKGTVTVRPGTDLTAPAYTEREAEW